MNIQAQLKKGWIFATLDRMTDPERVDASLLVSVFNIPMKDAEALLSEYRGIYEKEVFSISN